jgi:hypothetical protein
MTYFEDTGTILDASIEQVWEYLASERHAPAHAGSARNFEVRETVGSTSVIWGERLVDGQWKPFLTRSTDFPPFCVCNEEVEGDFAGSKFVLLYRPQGKVTLVDVYGDIQARTLPPAEAHRRFLATLQAAYEEDAAALREFRHRAARGAAPARDRSGVPP